MDGWAFFVGSRDVGLPLGVRGRVGFFRGFAGLRLGLLLFTSGPRVRVFRTTCGSAVFSHLVVANIRMRVSKLITHGALSRSESGNTQENLTMVYYHEWG